MRLYIVEIPLIKFSAIGADLVGKRICKFVLWRWRQEASTEGSHHHHPQIHSPHESNSNVHTEMYLFVHMVLCYNPNYCCDYLNLVAFIQNKTAKQLRWLLNQIVEAT